MVIKLKKIDVENKIRQIIEQLKPFLISDGGTLEYVGFKDGIVYVKLGGACKGCAFLDVTLKDGIEQMLINEIPEVKEVRNVNE